MKSTVDPLSWEVPWHVKAFVGHLWMFHTVGGGKLRDERAF